MLRNLSRTLLIAGAAWLAATTALSAQETAPLRGDVDGDGRVTTADARIVADYLVGRPVPAGADVRGRGDANGDGRVTSVDVALINSFAAGRDVSRFKVGTPGEIPAGALVMVACSADFGTAKLSCGVPGQQGGARSEVNLGEGFVQLIANGLQIDSTTDTSKREATFNVAVKNILVQKLGTRDGSTADSTGVRVFFYQEPTAINGESGTVTVVNATDKKLFAAGLHNFYQYPAPLANGVTTPAQQWHFSMPSTVRHVEWKMYVVAEVQFPKGWIDIYPPNHTPSPYFVGVDTVSAEALAPNHTLQLTDSVRNFVGIVQPGTPVGYNNPAPATATVSPAGLITGVADGSFTATATAPYPNGGNRSGTVQIVVSTADSTTSTITAAPNPQTVGDSATVTVQLKNAANGNLTRSGGTVTLSVSAGASITAVTDKGDGTYTAKVTSTTAGTYTISGTLNGHTLVNTGSVTFNAGAPAALFFTTQPSNATSSASLGSVTVTARDANNNVATSFTGNVTLTLNNANGATLAGTTTKAAVAGVATFSNLSIGKAGTGYTLSATSAPLTGATSDTFKVTPGAPASMTKVAASDNQSATVNTAVATNPAVTITDAFGNLVPNISVTFAVVTGGGSATGLNATTDGSGVATVGSWTLGTTAGSNTLTAASAGLPTVTFTATGTPDVPASITKTSTDPQNGTVGNAVASAPAVHVADQYGNSVPNVTVNFSVAGGGGSTTGAAPTTNASGNAVVSSWTLGGTAPGPNQLTAAAVGGSNPSTTFTAYVPPSILADSSQAMGNTSLPSSLTPNVLTNDKGLNGAALAISTTGALTTVKGGTLTLNADGTFSYLPPAGNTARDSVLYTVGDGHLSASSYVKIRFVGKVWYVQGGAANGDGRDGTPFSSIANAEVSAGVNDTILVRTGAGTTAGGTLKAGQLLYGQGSSAPFNTTLNGQTVTLITAGSAPTVGALTLNSANGGNTLRGMAISTSGATAVTGNNFGTLTVSETSIAATTGAALDLTNGSLSGTITSLTASGGTHGVKLTTVSGTITVPTSSISATTVAGLFISGGNLPLTLTGPISNASGFAVQDQNRTGGLLSLTGQITAAGSGISVTNSTSSLGSTGSVEMTNTNNTISTAGQTALTVTNTTITANGLTFKSISANGGANGIVLNNTGSTAGLTVAGTGSAGTGGTISSTSGSGVQVTNAKGLSLSWMNLTNADLNDGGTAGGTCDLANVSTCNGAIDLTNVTDVTLSRLVINGSEEQGIVGSNVTNFSIANSTVQNAGNAAAENGVYFLGLYGTVNVTSSTFTGNAFENFGVLNSTGSTPLVMTVTGSTFSSNSSIGGDGLLLDVRDGTNTTVTVKGSTFTANKDDHFQVSPQGSAVVNATFGGPTLADRNTLTGGHPTGLGQGVTMRVGGPFTGSFTFDINNNSINGAIVTAINTGSGSMSGGVINGKIRNNLIGTAGSNLSCSTQGSGILAETNGQGSGGTYNALITGNTLRQCFDKGIDLLGSRDTGNSGLNVTVTGNNVSELSNPASRWAIRLETGSSLATETGAVCADISGNTLFAQTQVDEMSIRQRSNTPVRLPGYTGGANNDAAVVTYLQNRNPAGGTATSSHTLATNFLNTSPAGSACPTPP